MRSVVLDESRQVEIDVAAVVRGVLVVILQSRVFLVFLVIIITTFTSAFTTYCDLRYSEQPFLQPQVPEQGSRRGSRCKNRLATEFYSSLVLPRTYLFGFGSARSS
jgi:hypothetical protein